MHDATNFFDGVEEMPSPGKLSALNFELIFGVGMEYGTDRWWRALSGVEGIVTVQVLQQTNKDSRIGFWLQLYPT